MAGIGVRQHGKGTPVVLSLSARVSHKAHYAETVGELLATFRTETSCVTLETRVFWLEVFIK